MKAVLDAYAVIAALLGERARGEVEPLLPKGLVCAPNLAEVLDVCVRVHDNAEPLVRERLSWLQNGGLEVIDLDTDLALAAGALRAKHYRKSRCEVSQGDCFALSLSLARGLPLATSDSHLAHAARSEGGEIIGLPDSRGRRP